MGNGHSGLLQELKPQDFCADAGRRDDHRNSSGVLLSGDQISNAAEGRCAATGRHPQIHKTPDPGDPNPTVLHNSGLNRDDKGIHVWHEIESMYHRIVEKDKVWTPSSNGLLPLPISPATVLMYPASAVAVNGENVGENHRTQTNHARNPTVEKRYANSSTSTAEDRSLPKVGNVIHGKHPAQDAHTPMRDVEMHEPSAANDCPRILESFSLRESCFLLPPGYPVQQEDKSPKDAKLGVGNVEGVIHHMEVVPGMAAEYDQVCYQTSPSPIQGQKHLFKIHPTSVCHEQTVTAEQTQFQIKETDTTSSNNAHFNGKRTPFQVNATVRRERSTNPHVLSPALQSRCAEPSGISQAVCQGAVPFCTGIEASTEVNETQMFVSSAAGQLAVRRELMQEQLQSRFSEPKHTNQSASQGAVPFCTGIEVSTEGNEAQMLRSSAMGQFAVKEESMQEQPQSHFSEPPHSSQNSSQVDVGTFLTRIDDSKLSNETEEFRSFESVAQVAVKVEPIEEQHLNQFPDKNMAFGINCENNGTEITLTYCQTKDKGTQYRVEDTELHPVPDSLKSLVNGVGMTKECRIHTRSDLPKFQGLPVRRENYDIRMIEERSGPSVAAGSGRSGTECSSPKITRSRPTMDSGFCVTPEEDAQIAFRGLSPTKAISGDHPPRATRISRLKRLLEKQEEELEKMRNDRNWSTQYCEVSAEKLAEAMDSLGEDATLNGSHSAVSSGREILNLRETGEMIDPCPKQSVRNGGASDCHETLAEAIRSEMKRQNRASKGKRRGECFAYLDSEGMVVFGRKVIKRKYAGSSNRLEKLIFRLRNSLSEKKLSSERKSKLIIAKTRKPPANEALQNKTAASQGLVRHKQAYEHVANFERSGKAAPERGKLDANLSTRDVKKKKRQTNFRQTYTPSVDARLNKNNDTTTTNYNCDNNNYNCNDKKDEFLAIFGLTRKTLDFVTGRFSALYGGPKRRLSDYEIQPTDCRGMRFGPDFEYRDEQGWFLD